ncbi:hypothetical protein IWW38_005869, partial [Coemansia aciculifera]
EIQESSAVDYDAAQGTNHTNSALSFQSITDSLFAQLNAKVSTPPTNNLAAFSGPASSGAATGFDGHGGRMGNPPGYPAVESQLFPPMGMDGPSSGYGRMDGASQFGMFGGQPSNAPWGRLGMMPGGYAPTPLSSMLGAAPAAATASMGHPSLGPLGEAPPPGGLGAFSRQRSRWDFVHADEVSAQAELQSVLGRGLGDKAMHPQQHQLPPGSFMSSRDLGMFSTPVQNDYAGGPWGNRQQSDAYTVPHPPPGFGGRQRSDLLRASDLGSGTPPGIGGGVTGGSGSNTLLSRLTGQASGGHDISGISAESSLPGSHYPLAQAQAQQQQFHGYPADPAILSSYTMSGQQQQQQQQQARGRGDPNVLNSLLARLHLGQGEGASPLAAMGSGGGQP